jgi:serine protease
MTGATVEQLLRSSARAVPVPPSMPIGAGMLDASLAVASAKAANPCAMPAGCVPAQWTPAVDRTAARVDAGSGATNAGHVFRIVVPAGAKLASVRTFGGTGDATLLVRYGAEPMSNAFDHRSARTGNTESVSLRFPRPGAWYVKVAGAHAGVSLHSRIDRCAIDQEILPCIESRSASARCLRHCCCPSPHSHPASHPTTSST